MAQGNGPATPPTTPSLNDTCRTNIRATRLAHGWTQDDLADRTGLRYARISRIETGWDPISLEALESIARAFRIDPAALLHPHTETQP